jgi:predicted secreted protein
MEKWQPGFLILVIVLGFAVIQPATASGDWNIPYPTQTPSMWGIFTPQPTTAVQPWSYAGLGPSATASPTSGKAPLTVSFSSTASLPPRTWNFGDGNGSSDQNPVHTYQTCGNYTVTLAARDVYGNDVTIPAGVISVSCPAPSVASVDIAAWMNDGEVTLSGVDVYYRRMSPVYQSVNQSNHVATIGSFTADPTETHLGSTGPDGFIHGAWVPNGFMSLRSQSPTYSWDNSSWYYSGDDLYYVDTDMDRLDLYLSGKNWVVVPTPTVVNPVYTDQDNGQELTQAQGSRFSVELYENPTTGFSWNISVTSGLTIVSSTYTPESHPAGMVGYGGIHRWEIEATGEGDQTFLGIYKQPWMPTTGNEAVFALNIWVGS